MHSNPTAVYLNLSDPAYTDRLAAFLASLGKTVRTTGPTSVAIEEALDDFELALYLRVWHVLYPDTVVTVEGPAPGEGLHAVR
jgi:hypothetical protein